MSEENEKRWRDVRSELPALGERVEVKGKYTPEGHGYPISYRKEAEHPSNRAAGRWSWESIEWRGTTGITHWRIIPRVKL